MYQLAVFGNPIAHSLSPVIHQQFAAQFGLSINYQKILVPLGKFAEAIQSFFNQPHTAQSQVLGCNITVPFKVDALNCVDQLSERAVQAGAINTIKVQQGKLFGDNTDGAGLLHDLQAKNISLQGQQVVIVGAGGAARGILAALAKQAVERIIIVARDSAAAHNLITMNKQQGAAPSKIIFSPLDSFCLAQITPRFETTLLIDATSSFTAVSELLAGQPLPGSLIVYDLKYNQQQPTPLIQQMHQQGITAYDGLGMLVEQAAEAFQLWFGLKPATDKIKLP